MAATTTSLITVPNPAVCSEPVTLTATVVPTPPDGTVDFVIDADPPITVPVDPVTGQAMTSVNLDTGTYTITASYSGTAMGGGFDPSDSLPVTQMVGQAASFTTLTADPGSSVCGEPVMFTATVAAVPPATATPTGTVTFTVNGVPSTPVALVGGVATLMATPDVGTQSVSATYNGDDCFVTSNGTLPYTTTQASSFTTLTADPASSVCGQPVMFTATVAAVPPGTGVPSGTVTFTVNGVPSTPVALVGGVATLMATPDVGTQSVSATYNGDDCFVTSNGTLPYTTAQASSTTTVTAVPASSVCGQPVTFTATVTPVAPGTGVPSGTVTFTVNGTPSAPVTLVGGVATFMATPTVGTQTVIADYSGDACFTGSTGTLDYTTAQADSTTTVTAIPASSVCGQPVTFTATVTPVAPGTGVPSGTVTFTVNGTPSAPVTLVAGVATFIATPDAGTQTVTAVYSGDACFTASTGTLDYTTTQADSTTTVTAVPASSVCGQPVTFTATVTPVPPGAGVPSGTVTFTVNGTPSAPVTLVAGVATFTATPTVGTQTVTADYSGDACFTASTGTLPYTTAQASSTTTVTAAPASSVCGQPVTFTATVTPVPPATGTPTGTVTFTVNGTPSAPVTLVAGVATFTATPDVGTQTVTAVYSGDACFTGSTGTLPYTTAQASSTTTVTAAPASSVCGQPVTFTATVTPVPPATGTPTGTVTFTVNGTPSAPVTLVGGVATFTATPTVGTQTVTAVYSGDACFTGSTGTLNYTTAQAGSTTTLVAFPNPSVCGQSVNFIAVVTGVPPGSGSPSGTVTFTVNGTPSAPVPVVGGVATFTATPTVGTQTVTAVYSGDACFTGSTGTLSYTTAQAGSTTTLTAAPTSSVCGQPVTFTATVTPVTPGAGVPSGTVTFTVNGVPSAPVPLVGGVATFTATPTVGAQTVTAVYSGDACFTGSTGTLNYTTAQAGSTTTVTAVPASSMCGQPVTFTATVTPVPPGTGVPSGTVTFTVNGVPGAPVPVVGGVATFTATPTVGTQTVTAVYSGDACFTGSTGTLPYTTAQAGSTTTVTAVPASSVCGQPVTFTATVTPVAPGTGTPTGTVTFTVNGTPSAPVTLVGGQATFSATPTVGAQTVTAVYSGDACFTGSTGTLPYTTTKANSSTALFAFPNPAVCGQSVSFIAVVTAVAPGTGVPTGTVSFSVDGGAPTTVPLAGGSAGFSTTLAAGPHTVTAVYSGDGCFNASTANLTQTVTKANSSTTLTASPSSSVCGQPVTFTATVTPVAPGTGIPSGTVTFTVNGTPSAPVTLVGGQATFTTTPTVGTQTVTAVYSGDACFNSSTASLPYTTTKAGSTTTLTSSPNPSTVGQTVTFTATVAAVAPGTGTPSGTVNFSVDGGTPTSVPLVGGVATFSTSTLTAGTHTVTATYSGDGCFNSSIATLIQIVSGGGGGNNTNLTATPATIRLRTNGMFVIPTLSATLTNATTGAPIPGQTITFTANPATGPVTLGTAVTNASGTATLSNVPASATLITASQYTATFAGAPGLNPSTANAPLTFQPSPLLP